MHNVDLKIGLQWMSTNNHLYQLCLSRAIECCLTC